MKKNELLTHYKRKFLGYMTTEQLNEVKVTNKGFQRGKEILVSIPDLLQKIEGTFEVKKEKIQVESVTITPETKVKRGRPFGTFTKNKPNV